MVRESTHIFIDGQPIDVGTAGDHAFTFEGREPIPDSGTDGYVFEAGSSFGVAPVEVIEDWEGSNPLSNYYVPSGFQLVTSPVWEGSNAIALPGNTTDSLSDEFLLDSETKTQAGDTIRMYAYFATSNTEIGLIYGNNHEGGNVNDNKQNYIVDIVPPTASADYVSQYQININEDTPSANSSGGNFARKEWPGPPLDEWVLIEADWREDDSHRGAVYSVDQPTGEIQSELVSVSGQSEGIYNSGGIGVNNEDGIGYADFTHIPL